MSDEQNDLRPPWWQVQSRHAAREARRDVRDEQRRVERAARSADRAARRDATRGTQHEPVTPERIADAALRIVDVEGLDGLTVRALAQELGLGTMTLYWYVKNKGEVLDLVSDRLLAGVKMPDREGDWQDLCRESCIAVRAAFLAHPRAVPVMVGRGSFGPNGLRMVEYALAVFRAAGFDENDAGDAYLAVSNYVAGFCTAETGGSDPTSIVNLDRADLAVRARQYISLLPVDKYPNIVAMAPRMFGGGDRDGQFRFGLDCLIAGFEARLTATTHAPRHQEVDSGSR